MEFNSTENYNELDKKIIDMIESFFVSLRVDEGAQLTEELSARKLSENTQKKLDEIADRTFFLTDKAAFFSIHKALIDHQLRIVQYYRLFNKYKNPTIFSDIEQKELEKYGEKLEKAIEVHDSDKLTDLNTIKHYIAQEFLSKITIEDKKSKFIFNKISAALRRIHGDRNTHHNEYYNYNDKENVSIGIIVEHLFDILSIGDKNREKIGEFYSNKKNVCFQNFAKEFDKLITSMYDFFKSEVFQQAEKLKDELTGLQKNTEDLQTKASKLKKLEEQITEQTEEVVWQDMEDGLDNTTKQMKTLLKNTYLIIEHNWEQDKNPEERKNVIKKLKIISDYKTNVFNKSFDLEEVLKASINNIEAEEEKLIRFSAILSSMDEMKVFYKLDENSKKYIEKNQVKIKNYTDYIKSRNETDEVKNFYIASRK